MQTQFKHCLECLSIEILMHSHVILLDNFISQFKSHSLSLSLSVYLLNFFFFFLAAYKCFLSSQKQQQFFNWITSSVFKVFCFYIIKMYLKDTIHVSQLSLTLSLSRQSMVCFSLFLYLFLSCFFSFFNFMHKFLFDCVRCFFLGLLLKSCVAF